MARITQGLPTLLYLSLLPALAFAQNVVNPTDIGFNLNPQKSPTQVTQMLVIQAEPAVFIPKAKTTTAFLAFLNYKASIRSVSVEKSVSVDEKQGKSEQEILRENWSDLLGIDIFMPYFKAKEIEKKISEKASIKIYKMKGKPEFEKTGVKYVFKAKF